MKFSVLTLFPEMIEGGINHSMIKRAAEKGIIEINSVNIRDFAANKHKRVDDYPFGGGCGMVMQAEPVYVAFESLNSKSQTKVIYLTPQGRAFDQSFAEELSKESEIVLICGHYEGIDERVIEEIVTHEISIGDFILTGGELGAMVIIDAVSRLVPGVLGKEESSKFESFSDSLLEYPQYTRPEVWRDKSVPEVLLSGHHENVRKWRLEQSLNRTKEKRPDLLEKHETGNGG